ncbi:MAG: HAD-IA family hydrolase [Candidatus Saccharimonadales bacterium]
MSQLDPKALKKERKSAGFTQTELARRSGVAYSTLTKLEQGQIPSPSVTAVHNLADALHCTAADLLTLPKLKIALSDSIKFVYFDVGGVLVHWLPSVQAYAERINRPYDQVLKLFYEYLGPTCRGEMDFEEFQLLCMLKLKLDPSGAGREAALQSWVDDMRPILPTHTFIAAMSRSYPIGLLTNIGKGAYSEYIERKLVPSLKYKAVVQSCDLGVTKPDSAIYDIATQAARAQPGDILFIDDSKVNVAAAQSFGWQAEWFDEYDPQASIKRIVARHFTA